MKNRLLSLLTILCTAVALAATAPAALADDSAAVAVNTHDNSTMFKIVFDIRRVMGDTVDQSNAAVAVASCNSCETVAIAIQVVLAAGNPSVVVPENLALAMNIDCNLCETLAAAYQSVYTGTGVVHFTPDGNKRIAEIRRELEQLRNSGLPIEEIAARVNQLNADLQQVLLTEIVPAGPPEDQAQTAPPPDTGTETTPGNTGTDTTPTDTGTQTTPTDTGTTTTPTDTGTSTSTTPTDTGSQTTPTDTTTQTTSTDTGTSTTPTG
jgi:putative peptide zinc metalloprotease protein